MKGRTGYGGTTTVSSPTILRKPWLSAFCCWGGLVLLFALACSPAFAADWQSSLTKDPPGKFPPLRPLHAKYSFGWSGFTAATAEVNFTRAPQDRHVVLEGTGHTI